MNPAKNVLLVAGSLALLLCSATAQAGKASSESHALSLHGRNSSIARLPSAAGTQTITFDEGRLTEYEELGTQYADLGVTFSPNAYTGDSSWNGAWASNTNMQVVLIGNGDTGDLGSPSLVSGHIMRSFKAWFKENGDPSFRLDFLQPISHISIDFAGVDSPDTVTLAAYDAQDNFLGFVAGDTTGQIRLSFDSTTPIAYVAVTPGEYNDWVGVDNISFTVASVPEPETYALMAVGLGALPLLRRRKQQA